MEEKKEVTESVPECEENVCDTYPETPSQNEVSGEAYADIGYEPNNW